MVDAFNLTVLVPAPLVVSASSLVTNPANVLTLQPGEKATTSGAGYTIFDLGAVLPIRQVFVGYTSAVAQTFRARASLSADGTTAALFDTGASAVDAQALARPLGYRHWFYHHAAGHVNARYVRIDHSATGVDVGIIEIGRAIQLEYNADYGDTSWGYEEADEPELLDSGVEVIYEATPAPVFNFTATWVTQAEMTADWEELGRLQHEGTPVVVARRPDVHAARHNGLYYGRLRMVPIVAQDFDMYEAQGRIRSMV